MLLNFALGNLGFLEGAGDIAEDDAFTEETRPLIMQQIPKLSFKSFNNS